ncbi:response regulator [Chryseosolibacter indicus]|uniref:Response regulator n=1 Tax=Chryseosolibacter indicus TaxID=2782351 RepID=A0ABS5VNG6_9BACT|nr:response regulator [Chryseosolibacter indicus]MBT1702906.1 response regulator [Chryseosolibacter indicus]
MKVLVCEDDDVVVKVIQLTLSDKNVEATFARDGSRAMDQLKKQSFDLIITDIHMPYFNGDAILKLVREEQKKAIPIIMISSDDDEEVVKLALKSGVSEFISKPIDTEKLNKKLKKYLKL